MDTGKLPLRVLQRLLSKAKPDPDVIIGPAIGEDAAALRFGGKILVAASDPVTFATDRIGYYAVSVNANDIASHGAEPRFLLATILLPEDTPEAEAEEVFDQIRIECERIGVSLIGGHTEITPAVSRVVVSGCMLGEVDESRLVRTSGARVGDTVILAGEIAVEGTSILAREAASDLRARGISEHVIQAAAALLDSPGICVLDYARAAMRAGGVTSMHDPTEGGLATALRELAAACGNGIVVRRDSIPILDECRTVCAALGLDPMGLIASGSLLIAAEPEASAAMIDALRESGAPAAVIGEVVDTPSDVTYSDGTELPVFERDEIARYFAAK